MSIRIRILLIVLPLLITSLIIAQVITSLSARNGITRVATEFLHFKSEQLSAYSASQWNMLLENDLSDDRKFTNITQTAIQSYAASLIRSNTELVFALNDMMEMELATRKVTFSDAERSELNGLIASGKQGWVEFPLEGKNRVAWLSRFQPFGWTVFITEEQATFYSAVNQMFYQTLIVLAAAAAVSIFLLLLFTHYLTLPLRKVVEAMRRIIQTNDLSSRVEILYNDETGELGHNFNIMVGELEKAYGEIKSYALQAVVAQHKEQKIRNIFQKYVPKNVIDQFFANPDSMLVGQDRELAVLFSDIRSFTPISEKMSPHELVDSLNSYFSYMVSIIMKRNGIVDKYMGDAIMAFFGAPVSRDDDACQAVLSALEMLDTLKVFNAKQEALSRPPFQIGVGIAYGMVTVGNIGSEQKMDYTVIGDMVNLGSRLEGLTKKYCPFLFSDGVYAQVKDKLHCRMIDKVVVKGKTEAIGIYTAASELSEKTRKGWELYRNAWKLYADRNFTRAHVVFSQALELLPDDKSTLLLLSRCEEFQKNPPPEEWQGETVMDEK